MESIGSALSRRGWTPSVVAMDSCACGRRKREGAAKCWTCESADMDREHRAAEGEKMLADIPGTMRVILDLVGMSPEHFDAQLDKIPPTVRRLVPDDSFSQLCAGNTPAMGFGLAGTPGTGKSMALAALVGAYMLHRVRLHAPTMGNALLAARPPVAWADWPSTTAWMRDNLDRCGGRIDRLVEVPLLALDDVGAERRVKASYEEEFAAEKLDLILHGRRLRKLPTIWTSNLRSDALVERYGTRTFSRLAGGNPCRGWITGKDLRFS